METDKEKTYDFADYYGCIRKRAEDICSPSLICKTKGETYDSRRARGDIYTLAGDRKQ